MAYIDQQQAEGRFVRRLANLQARAEAAQAAAVGFDAKMKAASVVMRCHRRWSPILAEAISPLS